MTDESNAALEKCKQEPQKEEEEDGDGDDKDKQKGPEITISGFSFRPTWLQRIEDIELLRQKVT
jgi:hypothetical protein